METGWRKNGLILFLKRKQNSNFPFFLLKIQFKPVNIKNSVKG